MNGGENEKLRPGLQTEPVLSTDTAVEIAQYLYGFRVLEIKKLDGYEDRNFFLSVTAAEGNKHLPEVSPDGYVMKVVNSICSKKPDYYEGQFAMMLHLKSHGLRTNTVVPQRSGAFQSLVTLSAGGGFNVRQEGGHLVYLLDFIPGNMLRGLAPCTAHLMYGVGKYMGCISKALQTFSHPGFRQASSVWHMAAIGDLREYTSVITDEKKRQLILDIVTEVEAQVLNSPVNFRKGIIHGDINESNTIVQPSPGKPGEYEPNGIIDYGDSYYGFTVVEVGNCLAYMMIETESLPPIECAGHVIAGFLEHMDLLAEERKVLRLCAIGRMGQSIAVGIYSHATQSEENDYLLATNKKGGRLLQELWDTPTAEFDRVWTNVLQEYGKPWISD